MGKTETVVLDEVRGAGLRRAIEVDSGMVGLLPALHGRRIVGIVVEDNGEEVAETVPEADPAETTPPKPRRPKK